MDDTPLKERKRDRMKRYAKKAVTVPLSVRTGDLPKRAASAVVMLAVAGGALWAGGWWWTVFVSLLVIGVLFEWVRIVRRFSTSALQTAVWTVAGVAYLGVAAYSIIDTRQGYMAPYFAFMFVAPVIAVDVGAYFAGRAIGGPRIAPRISPSKTWAGLGGGAIAAGIVLVCVELAYRSDHSSEQTTGLLLIAGAMGLGLFIAVIAQAGDFFESWMKRRAGVKDSGALIPGHGGLFDRLDGFVAVFFVIAVTRAIS